MWQSHKYFLEGHFVLIYQISYDSNFIVQIISINVFLPYTILGALGSLERQ